MYTALTREHVFCGFSTYVHDWLLNYHVNFRFVFGLILEAILARFGIFFEASGGHKVIKMSSKSMRKLASKKEGSEDVRLGKSVPGWWPGGGW